MNWLDIIGGIFKPVVEVIEHTMPSGEDKIKLQQTVVAAQAAAAQQAMEYEKQLMDAQSKVILAEAQGQSWLQRNWRPMMMVFFASLIGARWLGYSAPGMSETEVMELWEIIKLGLGGYVVGRSVEKIAPTVVEALKK